MKQIKEYLEKNALKATRYTKKKGVVIVDSEKGRFVFKPKKTEDRNTNTNDIFRYLRSRSFDYIPNLIDTNSEFDIYEYYDTIETPNEQKAVDLITLVSLLHNKTTYYKEVDLDRYKDIYEELHNKIEYLFHYYTDIFYIKFSETFMSPSSYLFTRNISHVLDALVFCNETLETFYEIATKKSKMRYVKLHNNLSIDHIIKSDTSKLISWDKSNDNIAVYDFYIFYKKHILDFDFEYLYSLYTSNYPLTKDEELLLFILITIPDKIEFTNDNMQDCININKLLEYLFKTQKFLSTNSLKQQYKE